MIATPTYNYLSPVEYLQGENVHLASVDFHCPIEDVYEDVNFESPTGEN
jgi:hypothetical protein